MQSYSNRDFDENSIHSIHSTLPSKHPDASINLQRLDGCGVTHSVYDRFCLTGRLREVISSSRKTARQSSVWSIAVRNLRVTQALDFLLFNLFLMTNLVLPKFALFTESLERIPGTRPFAWLHMLLSYPLHLSCRFEMEKFLFSIDMKPKSADH